MLINVLLFNITFNAKQMYFKISFVVEQKNILK